jgi:PAS domain-containing protein
MDYSGTAGFWQRFWHKHFCARSLETSDKGLDEQLARSEPWFRSIFERSNATIFLLDPQNDLIPDANPRAEKMLGYGREALQETPISAIQRAVRGS